MLEAACYDLYEVVVSGLSFRWPGGTIPDEDEAPDAEHDEPVKKKPQGAKKGANKGAQKGTSKAKMPAKTPAKTGKPADPASEYKPHEYAKQRADFIAKLRETGAGYREACNAWNQSAAKGRLLAGMSESENKRRRFI